MNADQLIAKTRESFPQTDAAIIRRAYEYAQRAHGDQKRKSGEPYIGHPLAVADLLADLRLEPETIAAALMHDVLEDNKSITTSDLERDFGPDVAKLVNGVTKLSEISWNLEQTEAESLRKMFIACRRIRASS